MSGQFSWMSRKEHTRWPKIRTIILHLLHLDVRARTSFIALLTLNPNQEAVQLHSRTHVCDMQKHVRKQQESQSVDALLLAGDGNLNPKVPRLLQIMTLLSQRGWLFLVQHLKTSLQLLTALQKPLVATAAAYTATISTISTSGGNGQTYKSPTH